MYRTFSEVKVALSAGKTVESIVHSYLEQIEKNKHLNAFLEVFTESALDQARLVDQKLASGKAGRLAGMVIGLKDNICYKGHAVSASSKILGGFESLYSATVVERLLAEDAIMIGRLNCDEFAMGSSNENSAFGPVKNNLRPTHVPGGSSGGSAVSVSAGLCTVALGSDTGGSIRQPASFTGTVGFKPTYGRVSRYGLIAYASSFDQIGPFTNNLEDTVLVMEVMAGKDPKDATSSSKPLGFSTEIPAIGKKKIAYLKEALENESIDPEVRTMMENTIAGLRAKGHTVEGVSFPYLEYLVPTYYVLTTAEASSNLSRFDGVHYGYQSPKAKGVEETYTLSRSEGFGTEVKRRIMAGTFVLSHGYYDAYYTKGMKVRRVLKNKTKEIFSQFDLLILPTTPSTAFEFGSINDPIQMYLQDIFTVHANLTGNPAIAIPNGMHSNGLPLSLQIMADDFNEETIFSLADQIMQH
ncbi:Asp-tRNA(Asn)/Glu-tRNA(Gln) amidotransferase subunit GatA [Fluviicola sp.]|uniref:Asp-tRNA(Asn)/Glu-tRNA(Gln) amidotransferase subunit GatA n=1 Tax=Fluviicola sp. TaxID=1917219 RepID=UPI0026353A47|nr:Asp-tRNA(Asn)/Glu-tRNA(Gln) amidotransferase subunit GatA [Fluviicola sp.]